MAAQARRGMGGREAGELRREPGEQPVEKRSQL